MMPPTATAFPATPLRLLFVIDSLGSGGAQRQMVTLATALASRGHTPIVFIYQPDHLHFAPDLERAGIEVRAARKGFRFSAAPLVALHRMLRREAFDAVLAYLPTPSLYAELATRFAGRPPLVVSERTTFVTGMPTRMERSRAHLHRLADVVVANSHHHREAMEAAFPWLRGVVRTIWNGMDLERFAPGGAPRRDDLLAVASIRPLKNARRLAEALVLLRDAGRHVPRIRWAGKIEPFDGSASEKAAVDAILAAAGLADRWEWLGERDDVPTLLRQHAALVHPSLVEGLSNAICEALASGLPVLAGSVGDQTRLVQDGTTGFLFDPLSAPAIADALHRFASLDQPARDAMGAAGVAFAQAQLSAARMTDAYEALFAELVASRGVAGRRPAVEPAASGRAARHLYSSDHLL